MVLNKEESLDFEDCLGDENLGDEALGDENQVLGDEIRNELDEAEPREDEDDEEEEERLMMLMIVGRTLAMKASMKQMDAVAQNDEQHPLYITASEMRPDGREHDSEHTYSSPEAEAPC